ncbi:hypothetical protein [Streptomyces sp. NPDC057438]|uniref:hypothetical protein n=1 Tax=Streptomyces sp. NPDC057438 TaxID=3346133 RepID=UPI0036A03A8A
MTRSDLTAAGSRYVNHKVRTKGSVNQSWQSRAWELYHLVPEVRFAATYIGNAMGGAILYAGRRAEDGTIEPAPNNHRASEIVNQIAGGPDGQGKLLGAFGRHLTVPGEGWIVIRPNSEVLSPDSPEDGHDWRVLSTREVCPQPGKLAAEIDGEDTEIAAGDPESLDPDGPVAIRVWESDPERAIEADSPVPLQTRPAGGTPPAPPVGFPLLTALTYEGADEGCQRHLACSGVPWFSPSLPKSRAQLPSITCGLSCRALCAGVASRSV